MNIQIGKYSQRMDLMHITEAELERLALLSEEASEVIQMVDKIIRFGFESYHPKDESKTTNRSLLEMECGHMLIAMHLLNQEGDMEIDNIEKHSHNKAESINEFLLYNEVNLDE